MNIVKQTRAAIPVDVGVTPMAIGVGASCASSGISPRVVRVRELLDFGKLSGRQRLPPAAKKFTDGTTTCDHLDSPPDQHHRSDPHQTSLNPPELTGVAASDSI